MGSPTLNIPPQATCPEPSGDSGATFTPAFTIDEIMLLQAVLQYYQHTYSNWNVTSYEERKFNSILAKIEALQLGTGSFSTEVTGGLPF